VLQVRCGRSAKERGHDGRAVDGVVGHMRETLAFDTDAGCFATSCLVMPNSWPTTAVPSSNG
jgi:hypothetical protein